MTTTDTATRILDAAERLVQTRGFNGFSYADVAAAVGIRPASIHYHFPAKGDLGRALVVRYRAAFRDRLAEIDGGVPDPRRKLDWYAWLYRDLLLDEGQICLCGMLAAEVNNLPSAVRAEVGGFFADQEAWLAGVLDDGRRSGRFRFVAEPVDAARLVVAALHGGLVTVRVDGDAERFARMAEALWQSLVPVPL